MQTWFWKNVKRWVAGGMVGAALCSGVVRADEPDPIGDLKKRIEALEQQNQKLQKLIDVDQPQPAAGAIAPAVDNQALESAVRGILDKKEEEKKAAVAAEAKQCDDGGFAVGSDLKMNVRWNPTQGNGLTFETANKDFRMHIGGRFNFDTVFWDQDSFLRPTNQVGSLTDGSFFRRLRVQMDGQFWEVFEFNTEYQFEQVSDNIPNLDEFWVGIQKLPAIGTVRIGHLKVQQGLESLSSSKVLTFMERSSVFDAFWTEFAPGIWATNTYLEERGTWHLQALRQERANEGADFGDGEYMFDGRLTALPYYENDGRCLLHLGASVNWKNSERPDPSTGGNPTARFRARPEMRDGTGVFGTTQPAVVNGAPGVNTFPGNTTRFVDTGALRCDNVWTYGAEFLSIMGPFSLMAEASAATPTEVIANGRNQGELGFYGYYVTASYFLTGENCAYDRRLGRLPGNYTTKIHTPFWAVRDEDGGFNLGRGAWEIAARYSWVNLDDGVVQGGKLKEVTLGLNWYLCPNAKMQFQYLTIQRSDVDGPGTVSGFGPGQRSGEAQGFGIRTVLEF